MANHIQSRNTAEGVYDVIGDPIAEILLLRIGAQVGQRENGHRLAVQQPRLGLLNRRLATAIEDGSEISKGRDVTSRLEDDRYRIGSPFDFVILAELLSQALRFYPDDRIRARVILGPAIKDHATKQRFLKPIEVSFQCAFNSKFEETLETLRVPERAAAQNAVELGADMPLGDIAGMFDTAAHID